VANIFFLPFMQSQREGCKLKSLGLHFKLSKRDDYEKNI